MLSKKEVVKFWKDRAREDREVARALFRSKKYAAGLFFVHIFLEKILKALVIEKTRRVAPFTHDLLLLAEKAEIELSCEHKELLRVINNFNLRARYDDYKLQFHRRATPAYSNKYFKLANDFYLWLLKKFTTKEK